MRNCPATEFVLLWKSAESPPDLFQFLSSWGEISHKDSVAVIGVDQQYRWRKDSPLPPLPVDDYLVKYPELETNHDLLQELAVNEFLARRANGERPCKEEFVKEFPTISNRLLKTLTELESGNSNGETDADEPADQDNANDELDLIGEAFEQAWHAPAATPNLEEYLRRGSENIRAKLARHLLLIEVWHRQLRGEKPTLSEYHARFAQSDPVLRELLKEWEGNPNDFLQYEDSSGEQRPGTHSLGKNRLNPSGVQPQVTQPRQIGQYDIVAQIGRGGMGVVYKGHDKTRGRFVAIKMLLSGELASDEMRKRLEKEAAAVQRLDHPGIVSLHKLGYHDGQPFLVFEFIDGQSLADRIADSPLGLQDAATLMEQVSLAIEYAHGQGIVHRDIKPHNILLNSRNEPKVTDFGLAKDLVGTSSLTDTGQILGTLSYMPPEQVSSRSGTIGPASDVYSIGATLYQLLCGRPPFLAANPIATIEQVVRREPVSPRQLNPSVDLDLETICLKCLQKQPTARFISAGEVAAELSRYRHNQPIRSKPVSVWTRMLRWARQRPAVASLHWNHADGVAFSVPRFLVPQPEHHG